jgi:hypothetical protein
MNLHHGVLMYLHSLLSEVLHTDSLGAHTMQTVCLRQSTYIYAQHSSAMSADMLAAACVESGVLQIYCQCSLLHARLAILCHI